jgi:hypothetical protein
MNFSSLGYMLKLQFKIPWNFELQRYELTRFCFTQKEFSGWETWQLTLSNSLFTSSNSHSFHFKINTGYNPTTYEMNVFLRNLVPLQVSIPVKFYRFMATIFLRTDTKSCQKICFLCTSCHLCTVVQEGDEITKNMGNQS